MTQRNVNRSGFLEKSTANNFNKQLVSGENVYFHIHYRVARTSPLYPDGGYGIAISLMELNCQVYSLRPNLFFGLFKETLIWCLINFSQTFPIHHDHN